jgi:hypothetical protein
LSSFASNLAGSKTEVTRIEWAQISCDKPAANTIGPAACQTFCFTYSYFEQELQHDYEVAMLFDFRDPRFFIWCNLPGWRGPNQGGGFYR